MTTPPPVARQREFHVRTGELIGAVAIFGRDRGYYCGVGLAQGSTLSTGDGDARYDDIDAWPPTALLMGCHQ